VTSRPTKIICVKTDAYISCEVSGALVGMQNILISLFTVKILD